MGKINYFPITTATCIQVTADLISEFFMRTVKLKQILKADVNDPEPTKLCFLKTMYLKD